MHTHEMDSHEKEQREALYLAGGLALIVLGTGLILSNPMVRKLAQRGLSTTMSGKKGSLFSGLGAMLPDIERYLHIRSL